MRSILAVMLAWIVASSGILSEISAAQEKSSTDQSSQWDIIMLGDSITKGVRSGLTEAEIFSHLVDEELSKSNDAIRVVNYGVGGERTDQLLQRLDGILAAHPRLLIAYIMYGTNDSFIDIGTDKPRISTEAYRENLKRIIAKVCEKGATPFLQTPPRWAQKSQRNGLGESPNPELEKYVAVCREVAREYQVTLIDHYEQWLDKEETGFDLYDWTTDGCHLNAVGHKIVADKILLESKRLFSGALFSTPAQLQIKPRVVMQHDDGKFLWYHPRISTIPNAAYPTRLLMTLQKHLHTSDHYSGLYTMVSPNGGETWEEPVEIAELCWQKDDAVDIAVADVTPGWVRSAKKVLAVGAQVRYSREGEQLEDKPRSNQTAYSLFDPQTGKWNRWRVLEMPDRPEFNYARSACSQWLELENGDLLLPFYFGPNATTPFSVTVVRCRHDGEELKYIEHGSEIRLPIERGLVEPSLIQCGNEFFLTLRNDLKGYVTKSGDGLHFRPLTPWLNQDGGELGSYNTQQHWVSFGNRLYLVYTRRGANNDHIMRHRAPLFIAPVDTELLRVATSAEQTVVAEQGGELGNFGACQIAPHRWLVSVCEGVWSDDMRKRGATGALIISEITDPAAEEK